MDPLQMAHYTLISVAIQLGTVTDLTDTRIYLHESNSSLVEKICTSSEKHLDAASAIRAYITIVRTHPASHLASRSPCLALDPTSIIFTQKLR